MSNPCEKMTDRILDYVTGQLSGVEAAEVERHIQECSGCKDYFEKLEGDDRLLCEFTNSWEESISRVEQNVCAAIENIEPENIKGKLKMETERGLTRGLFYRYAAAAAILIVGGLLFVYSVFDRNGEVDRGYVASKTVEQIKEQIEQEQSEQVKLELKQVLDYAMAGNVDALIDILKDGSLPAKLLAAQVLGDMGAEEAIEPLKELTELSVEADNPFQQAIDKIESDAESLSEDLNTIDENSLDSSLDSDETLIEGSKAEEPVYMSGYIKDGQTGEGIDSVSVNLIGPVQVHAVTDVNGFYEFKGEAVPGKYFIEIFAVGHIGSGWQETDQMINLVKDQALNQDFVLDRGCVVEFEVVDSQGNAVPRAKVSVYKDLNEQNLLIGGSTATDSNGFILLGGLEPSKQEYSVYIRHHDYVPMLYSFEVNDVNLIEYHKVVMEKGLEVAGYAYYNSGEAAKEVRICAHREGLPEEILTNFVSVDANGFFKLNSIIPGRYTLKALNTVNSSVVEIADINLPVQEDLLEIILPIDAPIYFESIEGSLIFDMDRKELGRQINPVIIDIKSDSGKAYSLVVDPGQEKFVFKSVESGTYKMMFRGKDIETKIIKDIQSGSNIEVVLNVKTDN